MNIDEEVVSLRVAPNYNFFNSGRSLIRTLASEARTVRVINLVDHAMLMGVCNFNQMKWWRAIPTADAYDGGSINGKGRDEPRDMVN